MRKFTVRAQYFTPVKAINLWTKDKDVACENKDKDKDDGWGCVHRNFGIYEDTAGAFIRFVFRFRAHECQVCYIQFLKQVKKQYSRR
jgi:hypothetical protein